MTDNYAVIGNPIEHSQSPFIHATFASAMNETISYDRISGDTDRFAEHADVFRKTGGKGMNVTAPFKLDAFSYATQRSKAVEMAGAANALKFADGEIWAENFDGCGLVRDVVDNLQQPLKAKRILLLGAGGSARGVVLPFLEQEPDELIIANRTRIKADALAETFSDYGHVRACGLDDIDDGPFDLIFNAICTKRANSSLRLDDRIFKDARLAYDLSYGGQSSFLEQAKHNDVYVRTGIGMLVEQAADSFAWWRGTRPDTKPVIEALMARFA